MRVLLLGSINLAVAMALVIPLSTDQKPLFLDKSIHNTLPIANDSPHGKSIVASGSDVKKDDKNIPEPKPTIMSCFCAGGSTCCNLSDGTADCASYGLCGV